MKNRIVNTATTEIPKKYRVPIYRLAKYVQIPLLDVYSKLAAAQVTVYRIYDNQQRTKDTYVDIVDLPKFIQYLRKNITDPEKLDYLSSLTSFDVWDALVSDEATTTFRNNSLIAYEFYNALKTTGKSVHTLNDAEHTNVKNIIQCIEEDTSAEEYMSNARITFSKGLTNVSKHFAHNVVHILEEGSE